MIPAPIIGLFGAILLIGGLYWMNHMATDAHPLAVVADFVSMFVGALMVIYATGVMA